MDTSERELLERELVETFCETAMCGIVCVAASRGEVAMGSGAGGEASTEMQRPKKGSKGELRGGLRERG